MAYSYKNKNGKWVTGSAAYNHFIKENDSFESHNRKMALFGAEHATDFLHVKDVILNSAIKGIQKLFSKKNNKNQEIQNEIKYFSQIKDFQDKYLSDLDDNLNASKLISVSNTNTFLEKKTGRSNFSDKNEDSSDGQRDLM